MIAIGGPTGAGKSDVAAHLACLLGGEVINFDSVQLYRDFNIGSAKPSTALTSIVPHHLFSCVCPEENFSAWDYGSRAMELISELESRQVTPVLSGGTGLYLEALLHGIEPPPRPIRCPCLVVVLLPSRSALYSNIDARVREMLNRGLLEEVRGLHGKYSPKAKAFSSIGYAQAVLHLSGGIGLDDMIALVQRDTRRLAKRQYTWWRNRPAKLGWLPLLNPSVEGAKGVAVEKTSANIPENDCLHDWAHKDDVLVRSGLEGECCNSIVLRGSGNGSRSIEPVVSCIEALYSRYTEMKLSKGFNGVAHCYVQV